MKKWILFFAVVLLFTSVAACFPVDPSSGPGTTGTLDSSATVSTFGPTVSTVTPVGSVPPTSTVPPATQPVTLPPTTQPATLPPATLTTKPTTPTTAPTVSTLPGTQPTVPTLPGTLPTTPSTVPPVGPIGWQQQGDKWYYYGDTGEMTVGFSQINGGMYYFGADGAMHTGWLELEDGRYYFSPGGRMQTGWILVENVRYYMDPDGAMHTGWLDVDGKRYYLQEDGAVYTGWLSLQGEKYYLQENGVMARGMVMLDGEKNYFTSSGAHIMLVNPWHSVSEEYKPELKTLTKYGYGMKVDVRCYDDLMRMLKDCKDAVGNTPLVCSGYRTHEKQRELYEDKVRRVMNQGYEREEAERIAATEVALPGTSEHHLGLAVDIVDITYQLLDKAQENTPVQKWLMENSWKYGFTLRYPVGKTASTGIIYEPWHYRYVGLELATELKELGLTLEEYLQMLTDEANT